jgi:NADH-quinone oxidoreductase subunit E
MVAIDDYYYEDLTSEALEALMDELKAGKTITPGSAAARIASAPLGGPDTLADPSLYDGSLAKKMTLPDLPEKAST